MEIKKPFNIDMELVKRAYRKVKANNGAAGVDDQSIAEFEINLDNNLYKLWNRMSSGCHFPPPVRLVEIPKRSGGTRRLGIPTVADRIAQAVVKETIEMNIDRFFHEDSYGYRPAKKPIDAVNITRKRCWQYKWLLEYDIKGLFDNIDHEKLMKVVKGHVKGKWQLLYIERWIKAPIQHKSGRLEERTSGTPQGGVISPLLSNLFMHYVFDEWMKKFHPNKPWARYADDGIVHCNTQEEAQEMLSCLTERLSECNLEIHPDKTKIVYCGNDKEQENKAFTFLGYTFQPRRAANAKTGMVFTGFLPAVSKDKKKEFRAEIRKDNVRARVDLSIEDIAKWYNPILRGWYGYSGKYYPSKLTDIWQYFNRALVLWAKSKYKNLRTSSRKAVALIKRIQEKQPNLFFHWKLNQGKAIYV